MSNTSTSESTTLVCANCGKEGSDVTNTCNKCKEVMYCNAACKKKHRKKHKKECERRVAELHDEKLFKQPPPLEDCPICMIRLPYLGAGRTYMSCCGKLFCNGCVHAFRSRITKRKDDVCPFCRTPMPTSVEEDMKRMEKRIKLNDARAIHNLGGFYSEGRFGLPQSRAKALELYHRAAELGYAESYYNIGNAYKFGESVERDEMMALYYWELAAMGGNVNARHNLGCLKGKAGNIDRALKHWMIAVKDGDPDSLKNIKLLYSQGHATKDYYAKALCSYQAYLDEIKSDQRDEAAAAGEDYRYYESSAV